MSGTIPLTLEPEVQIEINLSGENGTLTLTLEQMLRGPPGPLIEDLQHTLSPAPVVEIDLSLLKEVFDLTISEDCTLEAVNGSSVQDGKKMVLRIIREGAPLPSITFGSSFRFGLPLPFIAFSEAAGVLDYVGFIYYHPTAQADVTSHNPGFI